MIISRRDIRTKIASILTLLTAAKLEKDVLFPPTPQSVEDSNTSEPSSAPAQA